MSSWWAMKGDALGSSATVSVAKFVSGSGLSSSRISPATIRSGKDILSIISSKNEITQAVGFWLNTPSRLSFFTCMGKIAEFVTVELKCIVVLKQNRSRLLSSCCRVYELNQQSRGEKKGHTWLPGCPNFKLYSRLTWSSEDLFLR